MIYPKNFTFQNGVNLLNNYRNVWVYSLLFYLPICQILENFKANDFPKPDVAPVITKNFLELSKNICLKEF